MKSSITKWRFGRLQNRIMFAVLSLTVAAMLLLVVALTRSFQYGFSSFLNELALLQIRDSVSTLARRYQEHQSWDWIRGRDDLLVHAIFGESVPKMVTIPLPADPFANQRLEQRPSPGAPNFTSHSMPLAPRIAGIPFLLLDQNAQPVAGNPQISRQASSVSVIVNGIEQGRVLFQAPPEFSSGGLEQQFVSQQSRRAWSILLVITILATLVAWLSSRYLFAPIEALIQGAKRLAAGHYEVQLVTRSDELGALATEFNRLAQALAKSRKARQQWVADIAHELRTPIAGFNGELQALSDGVRQFTPETLQALLQDSARLGNMVEDLYQLSLSDEGALDYQFEVFDLRDLVRDTQVFSEARLADQGISLSFELPNEACLLRGDYRRMAQLMSNLLGNVLRYTDVPGRAHMSLRNNNDSLILSIADSAPGVPDAALPHLFERLYRVDSVRARSHGGAGLGLSIVRSIVDAHQGKISAAHACDGGLEVVIQLPRVNS
jgi:two-component system, OmpR family, sensor histidine kinase BaeS